MVLFVLAGFVPFSAAGHCKNRAESGVLGAEYSIANDGVVSYITILTTSSGESPGSDARVATFTVDFPAAGTYDLYARVRVGPGGAVDDSFFYANGFGVKTTNAVDWIRVNNLNRRFHEFGRPGGWQRFGRHGVEMGEPLRIFQRLQQPGVTFSVTNGI